VSVSLFDAAQIGELSLRNRVVMAPMTRCRATADHVPTPIMVTYYRQRAEAGLIVTEGVAPDANGAGYARMPGLWSAEQVEAWRPVTAAVHAAGGRIVAQLMHAGRMGHPHNLPAGARLLSPSATQAPGQMFTDQAGPQDMPAAEAMTEADIEAAVQGFVQAARNAIEAGFDGVELHGANGYLIEQFLAPSTNLREDDWGGDAAGRGRFLAEVARRVAKAIGAGRVGVRLSPHGANGGIAAWDTIQQDYATWARALGALGLAYVHVVDHSAMGAPAVPDATKAAIREGFGGAIVLSGGYDAARAQADLAAGRGELVAFGRPFLANPDLVTRLQQGAPLAMPDFAKLYSPGEAGYTDYPALG
jgi:N-ethylmaleimide reductase